MPRKISAFGVQTGAGVDTAADYFPIVDASVADASKNKRITVAETKVALGLSSYVPLAGGTMTGALTLYGDPASALQAVTKQYADGLATNLGKRQTVRVATTANIVIATALNSGDTLDGITLATSDLVLVKDQSTPAQNGVYLVDVSPVRSTDFDTYDEHPGSLIAVDEGTSNAATVWLCTSNAGGTLNTTPIVFSQSSSAYTAGSGLTLVGVEFAIDGAIVGRLATANTWALAQTFTTAPVFTDASGSRTALGLAIGTNVQAYDADLAALAGLTSAADKGIQFTGSGTAATFDLTTAGKALLDDADATAQRATLGLIIGTNVQAYDADLGAIAGLTSAADKGIQFTGSGTAATYDLTTAGKALLDDANAAAQRTTLGLAIGTDVQAYDAQLSSLVRQNSQSAAYTTVLTDGGKHILHPSADTTARVFTIDSNANVAYPIGTAITFVNQNAGGVITIAITSDTMRLAGAGTTGSRTLAANGVATALKITSTEWIISGTGLT